MPGIVVCPGCGAEIDPETGKATYEGQPVEGDAALRTRLQELEAEVAELEDELNAANAAEDAHEPVDDGNPFFQ